MATDVAEWVNAGASVGLLVGAVVGGYVAFRTYGDQRGEIEEQRERERRGQGERIAAWTAARRGSPDVFGLCLLNDSSLPVTELTVSVPHNEDPSDPQTYYLLPPGFFFAATRSPTADGHYGQFHRLVPVARDDLKLDPTTMGKDSSQVSEFSFIDASGQRWRRVLGRGGGLNRLERL